jgi:hypothetical protein
VKTTSWIPAYKAAELIGIPKQRTDKDLKALVDDDCLKGRLIGDHYSIDEESVRAYLAEHATAQEQA